MLIKIWGAASTMKRCHLKMYCIVGNYCICGVLNFVQLIWQWDFWKEELPQSMADCSNWQVCVCIIFFPLFLFVRGVYINIPYCLALFMVIWSLLSWRYLDSVSCLCLGLYRDCACSSWNLFRYRTATIRSKLPGWIVSQLFLSPTFGPGFAAVRKVWFVCVAYM